MYRPLAMPRYSAIATCDGGGRMKMGISKARTTASHAPRLPAKIARVTATLRMFFIRRSVPAR